MAGIVGICRGGKINEIDRMLSKISYRGKSGRALFHNKSCSLGVVWTNSQAPPLKMENHQIVLEDTGGDGRYVRIIFLDDDVILSRDPLGIAPLYYGWNDDGLFIFASEVKPLLELTERVYELLPGYTLKEKHVEQHFHFENYPLIDCGLDQIARELHNLLNMSVQKCILTPDIGSWLSGGLDSSTIAVLARPHLGTFHTFTAGVASAPDLYYAREIARYIGSTHHEIIVTPEDMIAILPEVIYHLESFDPWLVRSTLTNYLVARCASDYVHSVFSGEGGDELFGGYEYLKSIPTEELSNELFNITMCLHNTALQRVDRCASAFGLVAFTPFLNPDVVQYAFRIPAPYKIRDQVEKWILRRTFQNELPQEVIHRKKAKFWEGAGIGEMMISYAEEKISPSEFERERTLPNGWTLYSREELLYYRIFRDCFGDVSDLSWMGRTKTYVSNTGSEQ